MSDEKPPPKQRLTAILQTVRQPGWQHVEAWIQDRCSDYRARLEDEQTAQEDTIRLRARLREWAAFLEEFHEKSLEKRAHDAPGWEDA